MNAFGEAVNAVVNATGSAPDWLDQQQAEELLRPFFEAFSHELAEELRDSIGREDYPGESGYVMRFVEGIRCAANRIDPEVSP